MQRALKTGGKRPQCARPSLSDRFPAALAVELPSLNAEARPAQIPPFRAQNRADFTPVGMKFVSQTIENQSLASGARNTRRHPPRYPPHSFRDFGAIEDIKYKKTKGERKSIR